MNAIATSEAKQNGGVRGCDRCTLCCKLLEISALSKKRGEWCTHCAIGSGCTIYETRPSECRSFMCKFLLDASLDEQWRPSVSRIVMVDSKPENLLIAYVDPQRPDAWRKDPYYSALKAWSKVLLPRGIHVAIYIGAHTIIVLPDRELDVGDVGPDELVVVRGVPEPGGTRYSAFKAPKSAVQFSADRDV